MTRKKVLISAVVGLILIVTGIISARGNDIEDKYSLTPVGKLNFETLDLLSQLVFFLGLMIFFSLVFLPIMTTLFYPALREERRRKYPQMPDEGILELLLIKDWKNND